MNRLQNLSSQLSFPPSKADFFRFNDLLTDSERSIREKTHSFAKTLGPIAVSSWEKAEFPMELIDHFRRFSRAGHEIQGYECSGLSHMQHALMSMELARVDASIATFTLVHNALAMCSISKLGNHSQKQRWLPAMASYDKIGAFALTEPLKGSDASSLETSAERVANGWVLNGKKRWIGNAVFCEIIIVYARDMGTNRIIALVVERSKTTGMTTSKIHNKTALRTVQNADITFTDCFVPEDNRLPLSESFATGPEVVLTTSRVLVAWLPVGSAMGVYDCCAEYVLSRRQFKSRLGAFQLVQEKLARMLGTIQSMFLLAWRTSRMYEEGTLTLGRAALTKATNTRLGREVVALGREIFGGNGVVSDFHVGRHFCDMEAFYTYEGTYDVNSLYVYSVC